jgi:hypothetical protein
MICRTRGGFTCGDSQHASLTSAGGRAIRDVFTSQNVPNPLTGVLLPEVNDMGYSGSALRRSK